MTDASSSPELYCYVKYHLNDSDVNFGARPKALAKATNLTLASSITPKFPVMSQTFVKGNFWHESDARDFPNFMHKTKCQQDACDRDQHY